MTQVAPLLTAKQVAERFNTSTETVRRWTREGRLPAVELPSGYKRYRPEDVERLISAA